MERMSLRDGMLSLNTFPRLELKAVRPIRADFGVNFGP